MMSRPATSRLKVNPPLGRMPAPQILLTCELQIDPSYQRSIDTGPSQSLIRKIAVHWNWDLCQPLVVARRENGDLYVIDGQHRLEAAKLRRDIHHLPAVVVSYASAADEAASFVHLNQQRRPLSKLDVFTAAVASEDPEACAIVAAIEAAGLKLTHHTNYTAWKPGQVSNIGGIQGAWRERGARATYLALKALAEGFEGQVLRYAGTIFPGIAAVCARATDLLDDPEMWPMLVEMVGGATQAEWRSEILLRKAVEPDLNNMKAAAAVFVEAWDELLSEFFDEAEAA